MLLAPHSTPLSLEKLQRNGFSPVILIIANEKGLFKKCLYILFFFFFFVVVVVVVVVVVKSSIVEREEI